MAEKEKKDSKLSSNFTPEIVKFIAESMGVSGLPDEAARYLSEDATYRIKQVIQDAQKFALHGKRRSLHTTDVNYALKMRNIEPIYGVEGEGCLAYRVAMGGGREVYFAEEREVDLEEVVSNGPSKMPAELSLRAHWLAVDGKQPAIPENPPPVSKTQQKEEIFNPLLKEEHIKKKVIGEVVPRIRPKLLTDKIVIKEPSAHELSVEQQFYFREVTEACVGSDETRRAEALLSLTQDTGLHQMLPRFAQFISEGVRVNVVANNLALLIYLMRMIKSLLENPNLYLEKYLHEFLPAVISCVVSKQLCARPDMDNHWALRDFAAKLLAQICKMFHSNTNDIQTRVTKQFTDLLNNDRAPLATHYGAIVGLNELGNEVVKNLLFLFVRREGERLRHSLEGPMISNVERVAAEHVKGSLVKIVAACVKQTRSTLESLEDHVAEFGYIGAQVHAAVTKLRQTPSTAAASNSPFSSGSGVMSRMATTPLSLKTSSVLLPQQQQQQTPPLRFTSTPMPQQQKVMVVGRSGSPQTVFPVQTPIAGPGGTTLLRVVQQQMAGTPGTSGTVQSPRIVMVPPGSAGLRLGTPQDTGVRNLFSQYQGNL